MLQQIKFGFQRMFRGYSDDIKWSFEDYFSQFIPPIKEFCEEEIETDWSRLNPKRDEVCKETLRLINEYEKDEVKSLQLQESSRNLWKYVGENIGYYWN